MMCHWNKGLSYHTSCAGSNNGNLLSPIARHLVLGSKGRGVDNVGSFRQLSQLRKGVVSITGQIMLHN